MTRKNFDTAYTFDDVLLKPAHSEILPHEVDVKTKVTKDIALNIPLISSAMDTVTESAMAVAMAREGGLGIIHKNMTADQQAAEVQQVKRFESGMVVNPITVTPEMTLQDAQILMQKHGITGFPVVDKKNQKIVGILTNRDMRFADNPNILVKDLMTGENLVTVNDSIAREQAQKLLHENRIEKLIVVDGENRCTGLITVKDIERSVSFPNASKDGRERLIVGAAIGTGEKGLHRADALINAECDILVIDTAHGHSQAVITQLQEIKRRYSVQVVVGNIATAEAAKILIDCGADAVKVGIGPGSICTTRIIAGVGVPQLTAIFDVCEIANKHNIPVIADGGIKFSGDLAKAIAAGACSGMVGSLLAGTDETPGEVFLYQGRSYKPYRGMGSSGAMAQGSADRYFQDEVKETQKFVPEGVEGRVPYKGPTTHVLHQLVGGLKSAMGYTGCKNIRELQTKSEFYRITNAGLKESHVHDITVTREPSNYRLS